MRTPNNLLEAINATIKTWKAKPKLCSASRSSECGLCVYVDHYSNTPDCDLCPMASTEEGSCMRWLRANARVGSLHGYSFRRDVFLKWLYDLRKLVVKEGIEA